MKKFSKRFRLNVQDWIKGLKMAVGGAVLAVVESSFSTGVFTLDWTNVWHVALGAGIVYILHKWVSSPPTVIEVSPDTTVINSETKEIFEPK